MSDNNLTRSEEKKNAVVLSAAAMASLRPQMPATLKIALSAKQNFSMAAEEMFVHALNRTVWSYRDSYDAVEIIIFNIKNTAMESVATEQGLSRISDLVFGEAVVREFLFTLQAQFFSQFAEFHSHWTEMIENIALALTNSSGVSDSSTVDMTLCMVPEEIRSRMFETKKMKDILLANNWLIMFILTALWGRIYTYDELRANHRRINQSTTA